jgi:hypothetical protein
VGVYAAAVELSQQNFTGDSLGCTSFKKQRNGDDGEIIIKKKYDKRYKIVPKFYRKNR